MSSTSTLHPETDSNQRFIDRQMTGVVEAIVTHAYGLAHKGFIPAEREIAAYVDTLDEVALLQTIRKHPSAASTLVRTANDEDVLRWTRLIGRAIN